MRNEINRVFNTNILSPFVFRYFLLRRSFPLAIFYSVDVFLLIARSKQVVSEPGFNPPVVYHCRGADFINSQVE